MEKKLMVEGMMCRHCKASVEKALMKVAGVEQVEVDLEAKTACVQCSADVADAELLAAVEKKGFTPSML